nr:MAG TPA: Cytochrome c oxidase assembly protein [Caudoviricetes sp.]
MFFSLTPLYRMFCSVLRNLFFTGASNPCKIRLSEIENFSKRY